MAKQQKFPTILLGPGLLVALKDGLKKPFDKLRANGKWLIPFAVSLSNRGWTRFIQAILKHNLSSLPYNARRSVCLAESLSLFA